MPKCNSFLMAFVNIMDLLKPLLFYFLSTCIILFVLVFDKLKTGQCFHNYAASCLNPENGRLIEVQL